MSEIEVTRQSAYRRGFSLTEILVAITIFMIVSTAMITILSSSVDIYRRGEQARSANDEAMVTIGRLEADLSRVIAGKDGGRIFARAGRLANDGSGREEFEGFDTLGFLMENESNPSERDFVVWITVGDGPKRSLERRVFGSVDDQFLNDQFAIFSDPATPVGPIDGVSVSRTTITADCLHFGIGLMGTADLSAPTITNRIYTMPDSSDPYWMRSDPVIGAAWYPDVQIYTSLPTVDANNQWQPSILKHPRAVRITLILSGMHSNRPPLRLRDNVSNSAKTIALVGPGAVPSRAGSIMRIGDELIGYYLVNGKIVTVNSGLDHGPLSWNLVSQPYDGTGRGIYRSTVPAQHDRGDLVYMGEQFSIVRPLP
jgi:hypothetical protein